MVLYAQEKNIHQVKLCIVNTETNNFPNKPTTFHKENKTALERQSKHSKTKRRSI